MWYSELFDIVNKKGMMDLFAISRFEFTFKIQCSLGKFNKSNLGKNYFQNKVHKSAETANNKNPLRSDLGFSLALLLHFNLKGDKKFQYSLKLLQLNTKLC